MATLTRRIGLSLGADICWPICFEEILRRLGLELGIGGDTIRFEVDRLRIEPFRIPHRSPWVVVVDRLTHWFPTRREWIKQAVIADGLYVFNNPWAVQSMEKATTYATMSRLGLPVPQTWLVPPKEHEPSEDLEPTLRGYAALFDLARVADEIGYPLYMKPFDGGAWVGVSRIENHDELKRAYDGSGKRLMLLQRAVDGFDLFVRCLGVGPQFHVIRYDPSAALHDRYRVDFGFVDADSWSLLRDMTLTINAVFGWDFNSCECLRQGGEFIPIDFANPCPDSQVTSLHYHFPWVVAAQLRWALYCAATLRPMRPTLDWAPFLEIRERGLPYREQLRAYGAVAERRLDAEPFRDFCERHLPHFDEVVLEFFGTEAARQAVRKKVEAKFPAHEVERFTEHFWGLIQFWRKTEGERLGRGVGP